MSRLLKVTIATLVGVLLPGEALAWGPVTHLVHGAMVLDRLPFLPPDLAALLMRHPYEYLYGCIGADIVQAKKFTKSLYTHCHHWNTGWEILDAAENDAERAFARGYLSHLASDTFSHNFYLPVKLIRSFRATSMRHVYWEARFDANQSEERWPLLTLIASNLYPHCDELVERVVERTLFSFRTNKRIFDSLLALQRLEYWQSVMQRATDSRRHPLPPEDIERFNLLCADAIVDLMQNGRGSDCQANDPTGADNLSQAMRIRQRLRTLARRGALDENRERQILAQALPPLEEALGFQSREGL